MKRILGLDLGTNSIGWALVEQNFDNKKGKILGMGSRIIPMGAELSKFEQGQAQTKNANRRIARGTRKLNKRYKQRRNKLIYILQQLGMLPSQIKLVNEFSDPNKLDKISILPISKNQQQLTAFDLLELRVKALTEKIELEDIGKIIYKYNQLRGYSGGNSEPEKEDNNGDESEEKEKANESFVIFSKVLSLGLPEEITFKGKKLNKRKISIETEDGIIEAETFLDSLKEGDSLELQVNIRRAKSGDTITIKLPNKTSWRKKMENIEKQLADKSKERGREYFISELLFDVLQENKWAKIRNNVILRSRYESEFEAVWKEQSKYYPFLNNLEKDRLQKILEFIFPGQKESQEKLRQTGLEIGLKYVIKKQVVFYQREL
ncbi:MAG: type II CRISPR RNA-guided endonuclease Cas9 [Flavobacteriaceae bacterium]